jgi:FtsZ-binding cell division protein ZapB
LSEAHDELIATYRSQIAISDDRLEHIQKLQQIADDRMVTIEKMGAEAQRLQEDVSRLQTENEALIDDRNVWRSKAEAAASDLRQLQSSSSWRLTAPLRAARDVIGKPDKPGGTTT